jgi:hypothetical protein
MDAQDRDEDKIRRRDVILAQRFGQALDQMNPADAAECPDAEIVAAYAEQALETAEIAQWEGHFAKCARCRKILRVLAASADTPLAEKEVAQLGVLVSAARAPVEITGNSARQPGRKHGNWRARWLAPAIGLAAVLAVWFAMRPPWRATNPPEATALIAQAPKEEPSAIPAPQPADRLSNAAPLREQERQAVPVPDRLSANTPSVNSPARTLPENRSESGKAIRKPSASVNFSEGALKKEEKSKILSAQSDLVAPAAPAPPPSPPPAIAAPETPAPAPPEVRFRASAAAPPAQPVPGSVNQTVTVTEATPLIETTNGTLGGTLQQGAIADLPLNGRNFQALDQALLAGGFTAVLKAPSGSAFWRVGKGGMIARSADAGKTWIAQVSPSTEDWLAGAAMSDKICWLVGGREALEKDRCPRGSSGQRRGLS